MIITLFKTTFTPGEIVDWTPEDTVGHAMAQEAIQDLKEAAPEIYEVAEPHLNWSVRYDLETQEYQVEIFYETDGGYDGV